MKHTPGPWEVVKHEHVDGELWLSVNQHADETGMKEWIAEIKYLCTDPERQLANARLIAAAPELLDHLRGMVGLIQLLDAGNRIDDPNSAFCNHRYVDALSLLGRIEAEQTVEHARQGE